MMFMRMTIDVVFMKKHVSETGQSVWKVSSAHPSVKPWRVHLTNLKASDTLELPLGTIVRCDLQVGDELCID